MRPLGAVQTGIQITTKGELEIRSAGKTIQTATADGVAVVVPYLNEKFITSNPSEISVATEIPANNNLIMVGPITVTSTGTFTISGTLVVI